MSDTEYDPRSGLTQREFSIVMMQAELMREFLKERDASITAQAERIKKLESDVEGLVSLLGEH